MELKIGDSVVVVNGGKVHPTYINFYRDNKNEYTKDWLYDKEIEEGVAGVVNAINIDGRVILAIVNTDEGSFIINTEGLEKTHNTLNVSLDISKIVKEERYYIETNLGKFDITEQMKNLLK